MPSRDSPTTVTPMPQIDLGSRRVASGKQASTSPRTVSPLSPAIAATATAVRVPACLHRIEEPQPRTRHERNSSQVIQHVNLDRDRSEDLVLLPAVGEDPLFDDILDDQFRLEEEEDKKKKTALTKQHSTAQQANYSSGSHLNDTGKEK